MCVVSMVTDDWTRKSWPRIVPNVYPFNPDPIQINPKDFEALKKEVEELKKELKKARQKDIEDKAPICAHKDSVDFVKKLAEKLGVDLEDVFDGHEKD